MQADLRSSLGSSRVHWSNTIRRWPAAWCAGGLGVAFVLVSIWWLHSDHGMPVFDGGMHLNAAFGIRSALDRGDVGYAFTTFDNYPPLVHIVGALGAIVGGVNTDAPVVALQLVFVPLLVGGTYVTGRATASPLAGVLAVVFVLASPELVPQLHVFMLDAPEAALVAATVGALLASQRFGALRWAALAGILCGLGLMAKQSFAAFVAGAVVVLLLRGGWRNRRGIAVFALGPLVLALPWYLLHHHDLQGLAELANRSGSSQAAGAVSPPRYSLKNVGYYVWSALNDELLVPLFLLFVVGAIASLSRFIRERRAADYTPELLAGGLVGWLGMCWQSVHDPRYMLPAMVYLAVLGTGWIVYLAPRWRALVVAALATILIVNTLGDTFGSGPSVSVSLPGAPADSAIKERTFTLTSATGFGGIDAPRHQPDVARALGRLKHRGIDRVVWDATAAQPSFNTSGISSSATIAGIGTANGQPGGPWTSHDAYVVQRYRSLEPHAGTPCFRLYDGSGLYFYRGRPSGGRLVCP